MKTMLGMRRIMRDSLRLYFAPLTGVIKGIRAEWQKVELKIQQGRDAENAKRDRTDRAT
jgi:hypothetical protein